MTRLASTFTGDKRGASRERPRSGAYGGTAGKQRCGSGGKGSAVDEHAPSLAAILQASIVSTVTRSFVKTQTSDAICIARRASTSGSCS